jgi:uncharacterized RDD family membrane protein YckC
MTTQKEKKIKSGPVEFYNEKDIFGFESPEVIDVKWKDTKTETEPSRKPEAADPYKGYEFPSLLKRIQALLIDALIIILVFFVASNLFEIIGGAPEWLRGTILVFMLFLYEPVMVSALGGSIGHRAISFRVKRIKNPDKNIIFFLALIRFIIKGLLGWLSFITVTKNKRMRAIHDIASGSIVIVI